jgi:hypothetical protein
MRASCASPSRAPSRRRRARSRIRSRTVSSALVIDAGWMSRIRTSMPFRLTSSAMPPPMMPAPTSTSERIGCGFTAGSATTDSFLARSDRRKMRTRFLHTGPVTRSPAQRASRSNPLRSGCPWPCSITLMAASGAG